MPNIFAYFNFSYSFKSQPQLSLPLMFTKDALDCQEKKQNSPQSGLNNRVFTIEFKVHMCHSDPLSALGSSCLWVRSQRNK